MCECKTQTMTTEQKLKALEILMLRAKQWQELILEDMNPTQAIPESVLQAIKILFPEGM